MFPSYENDYEAFEEQCMSRYGAKPRPHWITTEFGGKVKLLLCLLSLDHNWISSSFNNELIGYVFVENIVSVEEIWKQHHILQWNARFVEPWRRKMKNNIICMNTCAHHADLRAVTKGDPEWLKEQRRQEVAIVEKWISEYYKDLKEEE
ncbi:unnamed protein product [Brassica rapa]|uniref:Uncharacterized protein n=2 Tax=Brassica TaxID=3705 RepID=A0A8D9FZE5_BRACM|nr:unnamed protein product [Brassica napus]CAG7861602.1 unnamed protein product [Brassica rapa]